MDIDDAFAADSHLGWYVFRHLQFPSVINAKEDDAFVAIDKL